MPAFVDLTGRRFGRLLVVDVVSMAIAKRHGQKYQDTIWLVRCDCGVEKEVTRGNLKNGSTISCGCFRNAQGAHANKHRHWSRWSTMHNRCGNPNGKDWDNYGGRGISVCHRWESFPLFLVDVEATFFEGATLERIDNNGNYEPGNVKWATRKEQGRNIRNNVFVETPWGRMTHAEAAERAGVSYSMFHSRVRMGWSVKRLFDPANRRKLHRWDRKKVV